MFDVSPEEMTEGSVFRALVLMATPLVAQNFALVAQSVVDTFWVGRLGTDPVAAIGLVVPITALFLIPTAAVYSGSQILVSQRVGADRTVAAERTPFNAALLGLLVAAAMGTLAFVAAEPVVELLGASGRLTALGLSYIYGWVLSLFPAVVSDAVESGFVGWGDSEASLYVNLTAIGVNAVVDPFLILGWGPLPRLELFGAALATGVGYVFGAVVAITLAIRGTREFALSRRALSLDRGALTRILRLGSPLALKRSVQQIARVPMVAIVSFAGGAAGLAAYTIGARLSTVAFVPAAGLGQATTSVVGQNLGAEKPGRARRATWSGVGIGIAALSVLGALQWVFPVVVATVFVPDIGGPVLDLAVSYLRILSLGYWSFGVIYVVEAGFNGAGRTDLSAYSGVFRYWVTRLPLAVVGVYVLGGGVVAAFWAVTLSNAAAALALAGYYWYSVNNGLLRRAVDSAAADAQEA